MSTLSPPTDTTELYAIFPASYTNCASLLKCHSNTSLWQRTGANLRNQGTAWSWRTVKDDRRFTEASRKWHIQPEHTRTSHYSAVALGTLMWVMLIHERRLYLAGPDCFYCGPTGEVIEIAVTVLIFAFGFVPSSADWLQQRTFV